MKCIFQGCEEPVGAARQFNDIFVRAYVCLKHLLKIIDLNCQYDGMKFIEMLKKSIDEEELKKVDGVLKIG